MRRTTSFLHITSALFFSLMMVSWTVSAVIPLNRLDYEMQKRFQPDWRNPGAVTLPNTAAYAQPQNFQVTLKLGSEPVVGTVYNCDVTSVISLHSIHHGTSWTWSNSGSN